MGLNFLALLAGAMIDRLPRHRVLAVVEFMMAFFGLLIVVLMYTNVMEVWHIFVITLVAGMVRVFQMPASQALVADTLPQDRVGNGAAFATLGMNLAMIVGPLAGGVLFKAYGARVAFIVIAFLYCVSGLSALSIRAIVSTSPAQGEALWSSVMQGLRYVRRDPAVWGTLVVAVIINLGGWTLHTALMPVFAQDVLDTDSAGLGLLLFVFGLGAFAGSVGLALIPNLRNVGKLMIAAVLAWHISILAFAASDTFYVSMGILAFTGMCFGATQVFMLTMLLRNTRSEFRGRVMSLRVLAIYAFSLGSIAAGAMAGLWGAPWAAAIVGVVGISLVALLAFFTPRLRQA